MMSEVTVWRTASMEGKWRDGKGDVRLAFIDYYGKSWIDLRIVNTSDGKNQHTRHGVRLTLQQMKEMLPRLLEAIEECEAIEEQRSRKED
jgi:hypothetical protein